MLQVTFYIHVINLSQSTMVHNQFVHCLVRNYSLSLVLKLFIMRNIWFYGHELFMISGFWVMAMNYS